jgi:hypothetical protein
MEKINEGDLVLVNPHTLKLIDSKGLGAKLVKDHWIL